jgi:signal transduction histidine kinase
MSPAPRTSALGGVDAEALTRSLQALSRELSLEPLLTNLLDVVVRTAGARRGTLARAMDGVWVVQASAASAGTDTTARDPEGDAPTLPQALLHLAASRPTPLVLADARLEPELARDPYFQGRGARSLLVLPITRHGRGTGVVLLENELVAGAFTRERVAMLELMSAQIAISLENAELYEDLKRNNASLAEALEATRIAARTKGILLANVSHELRTPLNGVIGVVELLRDVPLDPQGRTLLRSLEEAAEHLVRGVGGLIAYTEVESGELRLDVAAFDVSRMITRVTEGYAARAEARGLRVRVDTQSLPAASVRGDSVRLAQVLRHLLENALTYSERGELRVRVAGVRAEQHLLLTVVVEDEGIGMSPQTLAHAFDGLRQADSTSTKTRGGLGVGLAYARRALTLMGGRIELSSTLGVGTTATVEVPLALGATSLPPELSSTAVAAAARPRELVLVAEDNVVNQRVLTLMLTRLGMPFRVCKDGVEAVAAYAEEGPRVRCVLMDCQMPTMDGFEATLRIRGTEAALGWPRVPVIAVTANALASDRDKCLDAGMDDHLSKPVRLPELGAAIARATGSPVPIPAPGPTPRSAPDTSEGTSGVPSERPLL